ncbi:hypothetical protein HPB48_019817 [Haemaphysalis longicornis]|uniref:Uncharacterized protein n=1 Tax=Haemaphysalis longicornis TaxID=44386 RepID=A0A9J6FBZ9_HAELO|nr:hypothetical protein HPB48_019817 [Haemaphysalis longicornis]
MKTKKSSLDVFFMGKTHKPQCPVRVIASDKGFWLNKVSTFLQCNLSKFALKDPFLGRSSTGLVQALAEEELASATFAFLTNV